MVASSIRHNRSEVSPLLKEREDTRVSEKPRQSGSARSSLAEALAKGIALKHVQIVVTALNGSKTIEEKDGTKMDVAADSHGEPGQWTVISENGEAGFEQKHDDEEMEDRVHTFEQVSSTSVMSALVQQYPLMSEHIQAFQDGAPLRVVRVRICGELGTAAADAFTEAVSRINAVPETLQGTHAEKHGRLGSREWPAPRLATLCEELARPGYNSGSAHEYLDEEIVLRAKVALLAKLLRQAKRPVVYAGAGLSTSSGIGDYATKSGGIGVLAQGGANDMSLLSPFKAKPNTGHRMLSALAREGMLWRLVQQNHDGLPQKAGVPQRLINEIHGAWYDPSNPVVKMSGNLRDDLFGDLLYCERSADLVVAVGSSLCGMNADRLVSSCAERARICVKEAPAFGSVIVSLQRTPHDASSSLRIFAKIDRVAELLCEELGLELEDLQATPQIPALHKPLGMDVDVFSVPYDEDGAPAGKTVEAAPRRILDLREGAKLVIASGPDRGHRAIVIGKNGDGHWRLGLLPREGSRDNLNRRYTGERLLGSWWLAECVDQRLPYLPVVSASEEVAAAMA